MQLQFILWFGCIGTTWKYDGRRKRGLNSDADRWSITSQMNKVTSGVDHPVARHWHTLTGLANNQLLLFGGMGGCVTTSQTKLLNDTWIYNQTLASEVGKTPWKQITKPKQRVGDGSNSEMYTMQPRQYHGMATLKNNAVVMFGGAVSNTRNDGNGDAKKNKLAPGTYVFDGEVMNWRKVVFETIQMCGAVKYNENDALYPSCRINHAMVNLNEGTVLLFGGADAIGGKRNYTGDTWLFTSNNMEHGKEKWTQVIKGSHSWPQGRMDHALTAMGPNKVLLYGGCVGDPYHSSCVTFLQDLWMFVVPMQSESESDTPTWIRIKSDIDGACAIGPGSRAKHSMAWIRNSVVIFGGQINAIEGSTREIKFAGDTWTMQDGCPSGYYIDLMNGCQRCSTGTSRKDHRQFIRVNTTHGGSTSKTPTDHKDGSQM